jgi:hypothetical protein
MSLRIFVLGSDRWPFGNDNCWSWGSPEKQRLDQLVQRLALLKPILGLTAPHRIDGMTWLAA